MTRHDHEVEALVRGEHGAPRGVLGPHARGGRTVIRGFFPYAGQVDLLHPGEPPAAMDRVHEAGLFEISLPGKDIPAYRFRVVEDGRAREAEDPYRFPLRISDFDAYLFGEGTHYRTYEKMGAHCATVDGVDGVFFAVWAPNARRVSIVGGFNRWDGRCHPMTNRGSSGIWELFLPGLGPGSVYKYEILGPHGFLGLKADPYGFAAEMRPQTASVVWDMHRYTWNDEAWMAARQERDAYRGPMSIYEVHLGSWRRNSLEGYRWLTYRELAEELVPYVVEMGFTHVEFMPVSEHPHDASWGYQTTGYFAATSRYGTPDDLRYLIDCLHQAGIGVILDWVPGHFPKDAHGLAFFDGSHLYEHADPRMGEQPDWGTLVFNYGRNEVRTFLLSNAVFWAEAYHVDGLRVDAVASMIYLDYSREEGEWIPNRYGGRENLEAVDFLKTFNTIIHAEYPGFLTMAEESTAWPMVSRPVDAGGLGFGFKWNMGWMHDTLSYFSRETVHRRYHQHEITFSLIYAFNENFVLPFSHDEVVHGKRSLLDKMPGDPWQRFAGLRLLYGYMYAHPGKKLLFMGAEFAAGREWSEADSLDWDLLHLGPHRGLRDLVGTLNSLNRRIPALHEIDFAPEGFTWLEFRDSENSVLSFYRKDRVGRILVCLFNMTPVPRNGYRVGVPEEGAYREVLNTDAAEFGGSGLDNPGILQTEPVHWNGQPCSLHLTLPPLGAVYLIPENEIFVLD